MIPSFATRSVLSSKGDSKRFRRVDLFYHYRRGGTPKVEMPKQSREMLGNNTGNCYPIIASFVISDNLAGIRVIPGAGQNLMINRFEKQQPNW